jgi:hypothetical protein
MSTPAERAAHIAHIRALPDQLAALVAGWSEEQLDYRPAPGEWCARQIIHHVADSHMNAFIRMKLTLAEETPIIKPYDQEVWAEMVDTTAAPIEDSLMLIEGLHARWALLWESLSEADYARTFFHPEHQSHNTLDSHLATYSKHGREHIDQIERIAQAQGW